MHNLLIFGDSFADPKWWTSDSGKVTPKGFTWVKELTKKYNVINLAVSGSGPSYSITKLRHWLESPANWTGKDNTSVIFICSDPCRLHLNCYNEPGQAVEIFEIANGNRKHVSHLFAKKAIEWYMDIDWQFNQSCMYYSLVNAYSQYFRRVLYWPIGGVEFYQTVLTSNADNFYFVNTPLNEITIKDCGEKTYFADPRPNHLQEPNHLIMYEEIVDWIEHGKPIDTSKFIFAGPLKN